MTNEVVLPFDGLRKHCKECGEEKSLAKFHLDHRRLDGRNVCCAICNNRKRREYNAGLRRPRPKGQAGHDFVKLADDDPMVVGRRRVCKDCEKEFPLSFFLRNSGSKLGRMWCCRPCYATRQETRKARDRIKHREARLARTHGVPTAEIQSLFSRQEEKCAICRLQLDRHSRDAHVDHCHATGRIRGILCRKCNHGIGLFQDDAAVLMAAAMYLRGELKWDGAD